MAAAEFCQENVGFLYAELLGLQLLAIDRAERFISHHFSEMRYALP